MRLEGRIAVGTGGARGIGECITRLFAQEGAAVVIADLLAEEGERVAASIRATDGRAVFQATDVMRLLDRVDDGVQETRLDGPVVTIDEAGEPAP